MKEQTIIIGAGPAGLATAGALRQQGRDFVLLDCSKEPHPSWKNHYRALKLNSVKRFSHLPHLRMPATYPRYPSRDQFIAYLETYTEHFAIAPRFGWQANAVHRDHDLWRVETNRGVLLAGNVVVATGYNQRPNVPDIRGLATFPGEVHHSATFKSGADFAGREVLVVGSGNSAGDIALDLIQHGARPSIAVRSPIHIVPQDLLGLPAQVTSLMFSKIPIALADFLAVSMLRLAVGNLSKFGIERPKKGPFRLLSEQGRVSMFDSGILRRIKAGEIPVMPALAEIKGDKACFSDGRESSYDAIILATGFSPNLRGILAPQDTTLLDDNGYPLNCGVDTGNGLYFIGFKNTLRGFLNDIHDDAIRIAKGIV